MCSINSGQITHWKSDHMIKKKKKKEEANIKP